MLDAGLASAARRALERALELDPDLAGLDFHFGRLAALEGDGRAALAAFRAALRRDSATPWQYARAANDLRAVELFAEARELALQGRERFGDGEAAGVALIEAEALALVCLGEFATAVDFLRRVLELGRSAEPVIRALEIACTTAGFEAAFGIAGQLEEAVVRHADHVVAYRRRLRAIEAGAAVHTAATSRAAENPGTVLLRLRPHKARTKARLDDFRLPPSGTREPQTYHVADRLLPEGFKGDRALDLADILGEDLARLGWAPPIQRSRAYLQFAVPDCFLWTNLRLSSHYAPVTLDGRFFPELAPPLAPILTARVAVYDKAELAAGELPLAFVTPPFYWRNPAHSVVDTLSSLVIYEMLGLSCPIMLPGRPSKKQAEILRAVGLADRVLLTPDDVSGCLMRCAIAPQVVSGQLLRSWYSSIADRAGTKSRGARSDRRADVVYVSRVGTSNRPLVNEEELQDALVESAGARILQMEDLTLEEEVEAIRAARVVIGPHGAGMHSMAFAAGGIAVVELLPETYPSRFFWRLANIAGHDYFPVCGRVEDGSVQNERDLRWHVDVDKVSRVVDRVLAPGAARVAAV